MRVAHRRSAVKGGWGGTRRLSTLRPVSLSMTVDLARVGRPSLMMCSHSSSVRKLWYRKARGSQDSVSTHTTSASFLHTAARRNDGDDPTESEKQTPGVHWNCEHGTRHDRRQHTKGRVLPAPGGASTSARHADGREACWAPAAAKTSTGAHTGYSTPLRFLLLSFEAFTALEEAFAAGTNRGRKTSRTRSGPVSAHAVIKYCQCSRLGTGLQAAVTFVLGIEAHVLALRCRRGRGRVSAGMAAAARSPPIRT